MQESENVPVSHEKEAYKYTEKKYEKLFSNFIIIYVYTNYWAS